MKHVIAGMLLLGLIFSGVRAQNTVPAELQTLSKNWTTTINKGDLEGWLALHAENIDYQDYTWWVGKSRNEMRKWGEAVINAKGAFTITDMRMNDKDLVWMIEYKDSGFSNKSKGTVSIVNGKIQKLVIGARD